MKETTTLLPRFFLYSNRPSNGAKELANALSARRIRPTGQYVGRSSHTIINSGSTNPGVDFGLARVFNRPELVARSSNKRDFFQNLQQQSSEVQVPQWTVDQSTARSWLETGCVVVARTVLNGHSGNGIIIIESELDFVPAPLYTKYVKKEAEYRVHCIRGPQGARQFDIQRKIKDPAFEGTPNWRVRNHHNGFIYIRDNIQVPQDVTGQALLAFEASGLDFGAVDVIWNGHNQHAYVLEINTAPGLVGRSVQSYKEAFISAFVGS